MIWIDLKHKLPTDTNIPGWTPWTHERWNAWIAKSIQIRDQLVALEAAGKRTERNKLIGDNSAHWTELKPWLSKLSHDKCWFSEVRDLFSHCDVEHFRPKSDAKALDGTKRDGYWWLAFNYLNFRFIGNVGNTKKGVWFPLGKGSPCSTFAAQCEESESQYFIDPIDDYDVSLISFDEEGRVVASPGANEWERERVDQTAKLLKLNEHVVLAEERRKVWQRVNGLIEEFNTVKARCRANNPVAKNDLNGIKRQLRALVAQTTELSGVARCCLLLRNDPQLSRLIA